jgi:hypothetical protein
MKRRVFVLLICVLAFALPVMAQKSVGGNWGWEGKPDKNKAYNTVWLDLKQTGNQVKGVISISFYDPNAEDGSDAPIVPFIGTVSGDVVAIEFDADDTSPLDGSPYPRYVRHKGGAPNLATLRLVGGNLEWTQTKGSIGEGYPRKFFLSRNRRK